VTAKRPMAYVHGLTPVEPSPSTARFTLASVLESVYSSTLGQNCIDKV